jgi:hypothetical protein
MRAFLIPAVAAGFLAAGFLAASPVHGVAQGSLNCDGSTSSCLTACTRTGMSREDCFRMLRRLDRAPQPSVAVQPNTRSKYKPVPQGEGGSQGPGPYRNPQ